VKLRTKLAVALVVTSAAAATAIGWFAYASAANELTAEIDHSLRDIAAVASSLDRGGPDRRGPPHEPSSTAGAVSLVQRLAPDGSVLSSPDGVVVPVSATDRAIAAGSTPGGVYRDAVIGGTRYRVLTVAADPGAVQAVRSLTERDDVLAALRTRIIGAALAVVALAGAAGWLVARTITRRLSALAAAARTVAATGRLTVPIDDRDRDEAGQVATAFAHMLGVLQHSQLAQRRLAQDAGHELRTPLTSLRTNLALLARHPDLDTTERAEIVGDLTSESDELNVMVSELLALTAGDNGPRAVEDVSLARAATRVVERAGRRTGRRIEITSDDSVALASWSAVERAISNLIDNAVKFSPPGSPVAVIVSAGRVAVQDHGQGFAETDLPRVFDRFYRADSARALPGSGLGLAIVDDIARSFGGHAFAANCSTGGAEVGFVLPLRPVPTVV
jgi:two-component system sensor histidine kinase MprB